MSASPRAVLLLLVATALVACGGGQMALERLAQAAEVTAMAGSARVGVQQTLEGMGGPAGAEVTLTGEGVVDLQQRRGRIELTVSGGSIGGTGAGGYEVLFDASTVYLRLPDFDLPKPWLRVELGEVPGLEGVGQLADVAPADSLQLLRGALTEAEDLGREEVRGAPTTHYRVSVDLAEAAAQASGETRAFLERQVERLRAESLPLEVWLDEEGRVRRQVYEIEPPSFGATPAAGTPSRIRLAIEYYDYGVPVDVTPPPADQVTTLEELQRPAGS